MGVVVAFSPMLLRRTPPSVLAALGQSRQQPAQQNPQLLTFVFACPALLTTPSRPRAAPTPSSPLRCPTPLLTPALPHPLLTPALSLPPPPGRSDGLSFSPNCTHQPKFGSMLVRAGWHPLSVCLAGWKQDCKPGRAPTKSCFRHCIHTAPKAESGSKVRLPGWEAVVLRLS